MLSNTNEGVAVDTSHILAEDRPISKYKLYGSGRFWGMFSAEHVAATEFVIGATFVAWGVATRDIIIGLFIGNLLAVLSWALICTPIATDTRLTLYSYLKKIAGPYMQKIYNVANAVYFGIMAGAMTTVTASAIRELLGIPIQLNWYPTSLTFVLLTLIIGGITAFIAAYGFKTLSCVSSVLGPWLLVLFLVAGIVSLPILVESSANVASLQTFSDFLRLGDEYVWIYNPASEMTIWHVIAFAWVCNLGHHLVLSDMAFFRYAKKNSYGYIPAIGMLYGHGLAWMFAGLLGAAAAIVLNTNLELLDPGSVAYNVLGITGAFAVVVAGLSTAYPKIYRMGTAFQTIFPKQSLKKLALIAGFIVAILACFPFAFGALMEIMVFTAMLLLPVGAIIVTEHWIFPKIGYTRYWSMYSGKNLNKSALYTWIIAGICAVILTFTGIVHVYFLAIPLWLITTILYIVLAGKEGAKKDYQEEIEKYRLLDEQIIKEEDEAALIELNEKPEVKISATALASGVLAGVSLVLFIGASLMVFNGTMDLERFKDFAWMITLAYFIFALYFSKSFLVERKKEVNIKTHHKLRKVES